MKNLSISGLSLAIFSSTVLASGDSEGGAHIQDLFIPTLNFLLLFIPLTLFMRRTLEKLFADNAVSVGEVYELAKQKDSEAKQKLKMYEMKMSKIEEEAEVIARESQEEVLAFDKKHAQEIKQITAKMKTDNLLKIESEKKNVMNELNKELIDQVLFKAKEKIKAQSDIQEKALKKLMSQI